MTIAPLISPQKVLDLVLVCDFKQQLLTMMRRVAANPLNATLLSATACVCNSTRGVAAIRMSRDCTIPAYGDGLRSHTLYRDHKLSYETPADPPALAVWKKDQEDRAAEAKKVVKPVFMRFGKWDMEPHHSVYDKFTKKPKSKSHHDGH